MVWATSILRVRVRVRVTHALGRPIPHRIICRLGLTSELSVTMSPANVWRAMAAAELRVTACSWNLTTAAS